MDAGDSIMFGPVSQNADVRGELCPRCRTEMRRHVTGPIASYCPSCDVSRPVSADPTPPAAPRHCGCGHETPRATDRCTHFDKRGGRCTEPADHGGYHWYAWLDPDRLAVAPSRDSGALLEAWGDAKANEAHFASLHDRGKVTYEEHQRAIAYTNTAREALDRHLATLERDAARYDILRSALAMCSTGPYGPWYPSGVFLDERRTMPSLDEYADAALAALSSSGEPTATPETSDG